MYAYYGPSLDGVRDWFSNIMTKNIYYKKLIWYLDAVPPRKSKTGIIC